MPGINALLLGWLLYRSALVPRVIPLMGLIGSPLLIASATATLFRGNDPVKVLAAIATVPIFLWELSLGLWLVVKGFKPSPITAGMAEPNPAA
jgi:MFS-type transporter involved in bile tolerance (Atg22 family)